MRMRLEKLVERKFVGSRMSMSLTENKTSELWQSFMPKRKEIQNSIGTNIFSIQVYDQYYFDIGKPRKTFDKCAAIEVSEFNSIPVDMETLILTGGLYAVFKLHGTASRNKKSKLYIFGTWLPSSIYLLDNRPHFEVLGEDYDYDDPPFDEEIWIPIKLKK